MYQKYDKQIVEIRLLELSVEDRNYDFHVLKRIIEWHHRTTFDL